uniref:Uncharacterized protein n=1 Tax=Arundo donax TaxID=35708 RepID=A0A0A9AF47_ARUDO
MIRSSTINLKDPTCTTLNNNNLHPNSRVLRRLTRRKSRDNKFS